MDSDILDLICCYQIQTEIVGLERHLKSKINFCFRDRVKQVTSVVFISNVTCATRSFDT